MSDKKGRLAPDIRFITACGLCVFMYLLPFVSYVHEEPLTALTSRYFSSSTGCITDWFLYCKEIFTVIAALIAAACFAGELGLSKKTRAYPLQNKKMRAPLILCGVYAFFLLISGILSDHRELVLLGTVKQYEGLLGVTAYLMLFLAGANYFEDRRALKLFGYTALTLTFTAGFWAVMEYRGYPLQETEFMARLMSDAEHYEAAKSLHSSSSNVHITFFNSNYFGGFCGLMFPLAAACALGAKNIFVKIFGLTGAAMIAFGAVLSNSSGGLYSLVLGGLLLAIGYVFYLCRGLIDRKKGAAALCLAVVAALGGVLFLSSSADLKSRLSAVVNNGSSTTATREESFKKLAKDHFVLADIRAEKSSLFLTDRSGSTVEVRAFYTADGANSVKFYDGGLPLVTYEKNYCYYFFDERFKNCNFKFSVSDKLYIDLGYKAKLVFQLEGGVFKPYVHSMYTLPKINSYQGPAFFADKLAMGTGRGFIWGSTLSILDKCIFKGFGSGSFVTKFPQYDYVSLLEVYKTPAMIVNKPHSLYLGIWADSGLISLLAVLGLMVLFIIRGFKACFMHPEKDGLLHLRLGVFISVIAYMAVGVVNDSYVCVSPVFWLIFGVGYAVMPYTKKANGD